MEIIRKIDDLNREVYKFYWFDRNIILDSYRKEYKESTRHKKWNVIDKYERLSGRYSNMSEEDVSLPIDVIQEAIDLGKAQVKVRK
jgi:hypothetical protein